VGWEGLLNLAACQVGQSDTFERTTAVLVDLFSAAYHKCWFALCGCCVLEASGVEMRGCSSVNWRPRRSLWSQLLPPTYISKMTSIHRQPLRKQQEAPGTDPKGCMLALHVSMWHGCLALWRGWGIGGTAKVRGRGIEGKVEFKIGQPS
jgi:hypothetical protein